jgi:inward rectifier potassium channel
MGRISFDPGLTQQYGGRLRRAINEDGSFNVTRRGFALQDAGFYLQLVTMGWLKFLALVVVAYFLVNLVFAGVYLLLGIGNLQGADAASAWTRFQSAFFFSVHTLTTVGYGNFVPKGFWMNLTAAVETMAGLMSFALATGLAYGRFSHASANIVFSRNMVVAPHQGGTALMFRVANRRPNILMELEAKVLLMTVEKTEGQPPKRRYQDLTLERPNVYFLPLSWTVVHILDESSPLFGKTSEDLDEMQAEALILIKGFDDAFGQNVHARRSYTHDEIVWGARFQPSFHVNEVGDLILDLDRLHRHEPAELGNG